MPTIPFAPSTTMERRLAMILFGTTASASFFCKTLTIFTIGTAATGESARLR